MTIEQFLNREEQMKLTEELWITFGFEKYFHLGWKLQFENLILVVEHSNFPNTVEQLLMLLRDYYLEKGEQLGVYKTKEQLREFLGVKEA